MSSQLQIFKNSKFGQVRTVVVNGKIHFVAYDIAKALGYSNTRDAVLRHCRWVVKHDVPHPQNPDKLMEVSVIPEGDIYRLTAKSELPGAEEFESWIFDEVLPSIRKNGSYSISVPQTYAEALRLAANAWEEKEQEKQRRIEAECKVEELKPAAEFGNAIKNNDGLILIRDYVKVLVNAGIKIKQHELFAWMCASKFLYRNSHGDYLPYEQYVNQGLFKVIESPIETATSSFISFTTKLTGKGQEYFLRELREEVLCQSR